MDIIQLNSWDYKILKKDQTILLNLFDREG
jgi:hypothetical protein